jgi:DNA polymerase III subunit beta
LDESRPELNGALFQIAAAAMTAAATDSYRLSERTIPVTNKTANERDIILPARTIIELYRIIDLDEGKNIVVHINENQAMFRFGETEIVSRLVAGHYPDYKQIVPSQFKNVIEFSVADMMQAIKTTSLFCKQGINDVRISLDKRFDDIAVHAENSIAGKNISNVKSLSQNQQMDIVFNYKYLLDGLQHLHDVTAELKLNDSTSAALLTSKKDTQFIYIIMPIRQ